MDNTILELSERLGIDSPRDQTGLVRLTTHGKSAVPTDSSEDDTGSPRTRTSRSRKIGLFCERYKKLLILVFKSIGPDLKSFKWWQIVILSLFATFNVIFSVLVGGDVTE